MTEEEGVTEEERSEEIGAISPQRRISIAFVVLVMAGVGFAIGRTTLHPTNEIVQPILFNHQKHTAELELDCEICHEYLTVGQHAGLPTLETCLMCHEEPQTESPEEERIRELAAQGDVAVFTKLFRLPEHAYYSHRRHAIVAEIPCSTCHGAIAQSTTPPTTPLVRIDMDFCIDCHEKESVRAECTSCHH